MLSLHFHRTLKVMGHPAPRGNATTAVMEMSTAKRIHVLYMHAWVKNRVLIDRVLTHWHVNSCWDMQLSLQVYLVVEGGLLWVWLCSLCDLLLLLWQQLCRWRREWLCSVSVSRLLWVFRVSWFLGLSTMITSCLHCSYEGKEQFFFWCVTTTGKGVIWLARRILASKLLKTDYICNIELVSEVVSAVELQ